MKLSRLLFLYSFLGSTFLIVSGILNVKSAMDILYLVFLSPVLAYFILTIMNVYKIKEIKLKTKLIMPIIAIPIILSVLSLFMARNVPVENNAILPEQTNNTEIYPEKEQENKEEKFVIANFGKTVKLRGEASISSEIVGEIPDGTVFEPEEISGDWYKIKIDKNQDMPSQGWVHKSFVKLSK